MVDYKFEKIVNTAKLGNEIRESTIKISLYNAVAVGGDVSIYFRATLDSEDETKLNDIVAKHDPTPTGSEDVPTDLSNKQVIHETSRPLGTSTWFTSRGDNPEDFRDVGHGHELKVTHKVGESNEVHHSYADFNIKQNRTFLHEGYLVWQNCQFDRITMEAVPRITKYTPNTGTNFNLFNNYLIVPAAPGTGTINVEADDIILVEMPISQNLKKRPPSYWNAKYNEATDKYTDITPAPDGDGMYNMFGVEVALQRFVNNVLVLNDGFLRLQTADTHEIGQNMRLKLSIDTDGEDHDWAAGVILTMHRQRTA